MVDVVLFIIRRFFTIWCHMDTRYFVRTCDMDRKIIDVQISQNIIPILIRVTNLKNPWYLPIVDSEDPSSLTSNVELNSSVTSWISERTWRMFPSTFRPSFSMSLSIEFFWLLSLITEGSRKLAMLLWLSSAFLVWE